MTPKISQITSNLRSAGLFFLVAYFVVFVLDSLMNGIMGFLFSIHFLGFVGVAFLLPSFIVSVPEKEQKSQYQKFWQMAFAILLGLVSFAVFDVFIVLDVYRAVFSVGVGLFFALLMSLDLDE